MKEDWEEVEIGEVANIYNGNSINTQVKENKYKNLIDGYNYIGTKDVGFDAVVDYENGVKIPFEEENFKIAPKGCVLVCSEGGSAGRKTAYIEQDVCFGNKLYAITDDYNVLEGKYVFYYSRFRKFFDDFKNQMNGIIGGVSTNKFAEISFPLAPLPIQRAIVSKTEELFSDLDNGIANLKKAQEQLKVYRQAVLKKAFEGGFSIKNDELLITNGENHSNHSNHSNHINQNNQSSDNLPKGWKWVKLSEVCQKIQIGPFGSQLHEADYIKNGIPLLNPTHIKNGKIYPDMNLTISLKKKSELPNYSLEKDDIIMGRRGEMGRCALITLKENGWFCGTGSLYFRLNQKKILPKYLSILLGSQMIKSELLNQSKGTTMTNLNKKIVSELLIPLPQTLSEQTSIVQEIESRLSVCDKMEQSITESIEKAEALRQSILKKAFEGKLLSEAEIAQCKQAADYEPASELLKKIKAEKLAKEQERKKATNKKKRKQ